MCVCPLPLQKIRRRKKSCFYNNLQNTLFSSRYRLHWKHLSLRRQIHLSPWYQVSHYQASETASYFHLSINYRANHSIASLIAYQLNEEAYCAFGGLNECHLIPGHKLLIV